MQKPMYIETPEQMIARLIRAALTPLDKEMTALGLPPAVRAQLYRSVAIEAVNRAHSEAAAA